MNTNKNIFVSRSELDTEAFAEKLAAKTRPGAVILLEGDLGAGKTVFARGFARGLGIRETLSSPTYTIVQEYRLPPEISPEGGFLYHLDLYRIGGEADALGFGVDEFLSDARSIALVEWPERIRGILPDRAATVRIRHVSEDCREIEAEENAPEICSN